MNAVFQIARRYSLVRGRLTSSVHPWVEPRPSGGIIFPSRSSRLLCNSSDAQVLTTTTNVPNNETLSSIDDAAAARNVTPNDETLSTFDDAMATQNNLADEETSSPFDAAAAESAPPTNSDAADRISSSPTTAIPKAFHSSRCASRELPHIRSDSSLAKDAAAPVGPRAASPAKYRNSILERHHEPRASNPAAYRLEMQAARARPKATNPASFRTGFFNAKDRAQQRRTVGPRNSYSHGGDDTVMQPRHGSLFVGKNDRQKNPIQRRQPLLWSENPTLGEHLQAANEAVPFSTWVEIQGISPVSTLDSMLTSITAALDAEQARGMIDLDAPWSEGQPIPFLEPPSCDEATNQKYKWVRKAKVILSPFGRPKGWYMQFDNRSVVNSLLKHVQDTPIKCAWKDVNVTEYISTNGRVGAPPETDNVPVNSVLNEQVSDHTLRVENVPSIRPARLVSFFSRYDLRSVHRWHGQTSDGKVAPSSVYLVHFADASWARAALREMQGAYMHHRGERMYVDSTKALPLRLSQYPRQLL